MEIMTKTRRIQKVKGTEIAITREFSAPRDLVWKAWTDPEYVKQWWGPRNFTTPSVSIDLRVDGTYLYGMQSFTGEEFWSTGTYLEIVPFERIVSTDSFSDKDGNIVPSTDYGLAADIPLELQLTVTFEESRGNTRLSLRHAGIPQGDTAELTEAGWNESFEKLESFLSEELARRGQIGVTA
jgi:uncharacterized protein YndB with AHSA1/START domain